jgi:hypothetical protein
MAQLACYRTGLSSFSTSTSTTSIAEIHLDAS